MNLKNDVVPLLQQTWAEFQEDEAGQRGAALSYYAMFSIFPLLLLLIAILGFVLQYTDTGQNAQATIIQTASQTFGPSFGATLGDVLDVVAEGAGTATLVGLVTLLLGASGVFQQLDLTLNKIWNVPPEPSGGGIVNTITTAIRTKLVSFGMVLALGFLLIISLALTVVTQALNDLFASIPLIGGASGVIFGLITTLLLNAVIIMLIFRYIPRVSIQWSDVWLGAIITAIIWEIAKRLLALYIGGSSYASAYGLIGSVLVLMAWIYFTCQILFLGAEFTQVYTRRFGSHKPAPQAAQEPAAPTPPLLLPVPEPAPPSATKKVAVAAGAGVVLGILGTLITSLVVAIRAARSAASAVRRGRR